jgi:hypothetical protein
MTTTLSATYNSLVTLDSPADNPTTITWAAILQAGMEATIAGLTVTNAGEVLNGSNGIGIILDLGGSITNVNGGTISAYYGIKDLYGSLAVVNSGSIGGNNTGIYALAANGTQPFSVSNQRGGTITGGIVGIGLAGAAGTVVNAGSIQGSASFGVNLYDGGSITNQVSSAISGGVSGGEVLNVLNAGTIQGASFSNGVALNGGGSVSNQAGGLIKGGIDGIYGAGGTVSVINAGTILGAPASNAASVSNGVALNAGGSVNNQAGGLIKGGIDGIYGSGGTVSVINAGTIIGNTASKAAAGIILQSGGAITNQTKSLISGHDGIYEAGPATVTNFGTISGTIGIDFAPRDLSNQTVINAGSISGSGGTAVAFGGGGSNLLVLETGSSLKGVALGAPSALNTVELLGTVSATYGSTGLVNFQTVIFGPGISNAGTLVIPNDLSLPTLFEGFTSPLDAINLTGLSDSAGTATTSFNSQTDVLTVTSGSNAVQLQLDNENYSNITFGVLKLPGGGTEVQALPPPTVTGVTTSPTSGDFGLGKIITLKVSFTETVSVSGGIPSLLLNDGGTATYTSGSGTNTLTFTYTVGAGQDTPALAITGTNLNGASIRHGSGGQGILTGADGALPGIVQIDTTNLLYVNDLKTKTVNAYTVGVPYTGTVPGILHQYVPTTTDPLEVITSSPDWYIMTKPGNDVIDVSRGGGNNILSDSTGFSFLTGGSGDDTFITNDTTLTATTWNTISGFHAGENATITGLSLSDFTMTYTNTMPGALGLTFDFIQNKTNINAFVTFAGYSAADYLDGRLSVSFGTIAKTSTTPATPYMLVHGN